MGFGTLDNSLLINSLEDNVTTLARAHIRWLRNTAPYINAHRGKTFVLMMEGAVALHENFSHIIHDIALLNSLGVRLVVIHGSRLQIDQRLQRAGLPSAFHQGMRITDNAAMEHVKDAAGSLRARGIGRRSVKQVPAAGVEVTSIVPPISVVSSVRLWAPNWSSAA